MAKQKTLGQGISAWVVGIELFEMFPDEASARKGLEDLRWSDGRYCSRCGARNTGEVPNEKPKVRG